MKVLCQKSLLRQALSVNRSRCMIWCAKQLTHGVAIVYSAKSGLGRQ